MFCVTVKIPNTGMWYALPETFRLGYGDAIDFARKLRTENAYQTSRVEYWGPNRRKIVVYTTSA